MNVKAAACAILIGGLAAWFALSTGTNRSRPAHLDAAAPSPLDARGVELAREAARLQRRDDAGSPPRHARDPFRFAETAPRLSRTPPVALPAVIAPAPQPPRPPLKLIGVAEDSETGTPVRTAIIAAPDQVYVVKEGERVMSRYGVARISADVVELVDTADASALRLALK
jgi:hypothetical protein